MSGEKPTGMPSQAQAEAAAVAYYRDLLDKGIQVPPAAAWLATQYTLTTAPQHLTGVVQALAHEVDRDTERPS